MGYHPCSIGFLTSRREPAVGQCQAGSLTGAVASERVSEALKGSLRMVGLRGAVLSTRDRDGQTTGVSVVDQRHGRVAKFGTDKR